MTKKQPVSLESLPTGVPARILTLRLNPAESQRLMEMGLTPGTSIRVLKRAPLGDPIELLVRGGHLSLRKTVARSIFVDPTDPQGTE